MRSMVSIFIFFLAGCVSLKTAYQRFVEWGDQEVALHKTLDKYDLDPRYPLGRYFADSHDLTGKEMDHDGFWIYHYAMRVLTGEYVCHYHLVVDPGTSVVVGWGFDTELGDPKETCGVAG
jgi:hypothetical protein